MGMFSGHSVAILPRAATAGRGCKTSGTHRVASLRESAGACTKFRGVALECGEYWAVGRPREPIRADGLQHLSSESRRGSVFIEFYDDRPLTTANFLQYVNGGLYNNSLMHRLFINNPYVLQGGGYYPQYIDEPATLLEKSLNPTATVDLDGNPATANPTVNNEYNNSPPRLNAAGTIAMAKVRGQSQ